MGIPEMLCYSTAYIVCLLTALRVLSDRPLPPPALSVYQGKVAQFHSFSAKTTLLARGLRAILN